MVAYRKRVPESFGQLGLNHLDRHAGRPRSKDRTTLSVGLRNIRTEKIVAELLNFGACKNRNLLAVFFRRDGMIKVDPPLVALGTIIGNRFKGVAQYEVYLPELQAQDIFRRQPLAVLQLIEKGQTVGCVAGR